MRGSNKAFTLIELVVVMTIIGILAVLIVAAIRTVKRNSTETTNRSNARNTLMGYEAYYSKYGRYPSTGDGSLLCTPITQACWDSLSKNTLDNAVNTGTYVGGGVKLSDSGASITNTCPNGGGVVISSSTRVIIVPLAYDCFTQMWGDRLEIGS